MNLLPSVLYNKMKKLELRRACHFPKVTQLVRVTAGTPYVSLKCYLFELCFSVY